MDKNSKSAHSSDATFLAVIPGSKISLAALDPRSTPGIDLSKVAKAGKHGDEARRSEDDRGGPKQAARPKPASDHTSKHSDSPEDKASAAVRSRAEQELQSNVKRIAQLQEVLFAENTRALLVVLQGMDTSGKDGVLRNVFAGVNPQGCVVTSFKKPSESEMDRDFLWRVHNAVPGKGTIGVFNRSHYEDVLIVRVHNFVPEKVWQRRYTMINEFEHILAESGVKVLKLMLHISKEEQLERLKARVADPAKRWKFNPLDLKERGYWSEYMKAYEEALHRCSTQSAPWRVIPADRKWYRNWAVSVIVRRALEEMDPKPPKVEWDPKTIKLV